MLKTNSMFELQFLKTKHKKDVEKNIEFVKWLLENHFTFKIRGPQNPGIKYFFDVQPEMKEWAEKKLEELALVNRFSIQEVPSCSCPCHRGWCDMIEFMACCDNVGMIF